MGGVSSTGICPTYEVNPGSGHRVCLHSKPKYDKLIRTSVPGYHVKVINGVRSGLAASSNTHARYGGADLEADGYTKADVIAECRRAREAGFMAYPRFWNGNWHIHMADPDCNNMHRALAAQFYLFGKGWDALVGNHPDPLGGYLRSNIMGAYNNIVAAVGNVAGAVVKNATSGPVITMLSPIAMNMGIGIAAGELRPNKNNNSHVARLQSGMWNWRGVEFRKGLVGKYNIRTRAVLYDGDYGPMTVWMVQDCYRLLDRLDGPGAGWLTPAQRRGLAPAPTWPGPKFLHRIGFTKII